MAKSISSRFGLTRWGASTDTWSRAEIDANFGQIEAAGGYTRTDVAANRGAPQRNLEWFIASDTGAVSFGRLAGGTWADLGRLGSAQTWSALQTFTAGIVVDAVTASKSVYGALGTMSFTTESARDSFYTSIGGITGTQTCWLTAPTVGKPGLYLYDGTRWRPTAGHRVAATQTTTGNALLTSGGVSPVLFPAGSTNLIDTTAGMWAPTTGIFTASYPCIVEASGTVSVQESAAGLSFNAGFSKNSASSYEVRGRVSVAANEVVAVQLSTMQFVLAVGDTLKMYANASGNAPGQTTFPAGTHISLVVV